MPFLLFLLGIIYKNWPFLLMSHSRQLISRITLSLTETCIINQHSKSAFSQASVLPK